MNESVGKWIACIRTGNVDVYTGSVQMQCEICTHDIWVGPASQKMIRDEGMHVMCVECAVSGIDEQTKVTLRPEHVAEFFAWERRN